MTNLSQLAEEYAQEQMGVLRDSVTELRLDFLAGAHAVLKCPEVVGLDASLAALLETVECREDEDCDHCVATQALAAFEKLAKECGE